MEEVYGVIKSGHIATGHGGRDVLLKHLRMNYDNITKEQINGFLTLCEECQLKKVRPKKSVVVKPIISHGLNSRCQIDLIDMQSQPDGPYKFILNYQDHLTKFVILRPLKSKTAEEVALNVVDIFCLMGAPLILQSDNGREFANKIVSEIAALWPECHIVHGKPRHSQSQGSVERANRDVEDKIACWQRDNKTTKWSHGLRFVQLQKNTCLHSAIGRSPYESLYGGEVKIGLSSTVLPSEVLSRLRSEEDLETVLGLTPNLETIPEEDEDNGNDFCVVCDLACQADIKCSVCEHSVHLSPCSEESAGTSSSPRKLKCNHCHNADKIKDHREKSLKGITKQADKMTTRTANRLKHVSVGDNVMIPIPEVDRGRGDHRNILAIVMSESNGFLKLGTRHGTLEHQYTRNQILFCDETFLKLEDVINTEISLRTAARLSSTGTGQGFVKCFCKGDCTTNRCKCKKKKLLCNSKCHSSLSCCNK